MITRRVLDDITPSVTLTLNSKVKDMRKEGKNVISFTVGEPDFHTPEYIKQEGIKAIQNNFTKYTPGAGIKELREAIAKKLKQENNIDYSMENIVVSSGGKQAISSAIYALTDPGDEVIIPSPFWLSYPVIAKITGAKPKIVKTLPQNDYRITPEELKKEITEKTKILMLNSPSNPTGIVYRKEHLEALVPVIKESNITVISDEIYEQLIYDELTFTSLAQYEEIKDQVIIINGVSKSFAMTGWRIGYAAVPDKNVAKAMVKVQSHLTGSSCAISQKASCAAIEEKLKDQNKLKDMIETFQNRRDLAYDLITRIPNLKCSRPQGAFYLFPQVDYFYKNGIENSTQLANHLLQNFNVAVVPGGDFGNDENIRISFATSDENIKEGIARIEKALLSIG